MKIRFAKKEDCQEIHRLIVVKHIKGCTYIIEVGYFWPSVIFLKSSRYRVPYFELVYSSLHGYLDVRNTRKYIYIYIIFFWDIIILRNPIKPSYTALIILKIKEMLSSLFQELAEYEKMPEGPKIGAKGIILFANSRIMSRVTS